MHTQQPVEVSSKFQVEAESQIKGIPRHACAGIEGRKKYSSTYSQPRRCGTFTKFSAKMFTNFVPRE